MTNPIIGNNNQILWDVFLKKSNKPLIVGHRGMGTSVEGGLSHYVENSTESVLKSLNIGCDGAEIDVFLTKNDQLAVIHCTFDGNISANVQNRSELIEEYNGELSDLPLKLPEAIDNYNHLNDKNPTVPSLSHVLDSIVQGVPNGTKFVNVELKGNKRELATRVLQLLGKYQIPFLISSFKYDFSKAMDDLMVDFIPPTDILADLVDNPLGIPLGVIAYDYDSLKITIDLVIHITNKYKASWIILSHENQIICPETNAVFKISSPQAREFINKVHDLHLYVGIYMSTNQDDHQVIQDCCLNGSDMLIVNDTEAALKIRNSVQPTTKKHDEF